MRIVLIPALILSLVAVSGTGVCAQPGVSIGFLKTDPLISAKNLENQDVYTDLFQTRLLREGLESYLCDIPQLQAYDWGKAKEDVKKSTLFLTRI